MNSLVDSKLLASLNRAQINHGKIIIGFDFDDTVSPCRESYYALSPARTTLKRAKELGHSLICVTNNSDLEKVKCFCETHGFSPLTVNANIVPVFFKQRKIYVNIMLDDKSCLDACVATLNEFLNNQTSQTI